MATHLGISYQAISKWERGDGYPDITMLPTLANYFGVSVDELIGMEEISSAKKLDEINLKWQENRSLGKHKENVELMQNALKTYPNNALLLIQLSASLERLDGSEKEKQAFLKESIMIQEQILKYCSDSEVRGAALFNIADAYYRYGNYEKAVEYAEKLPNLYKTRETALVRILKSSADKNKIAKSATVVYCLILRHFFSLVTPSKTFNEWLELSDLFPQKNNSRTFVREFSICYTLGRKDVKYGKSDKKLYGKTRGYNSRSRYQSKRLGLAMPIYRDGRRTYII